MLAARRRCSGHVPATAILDAAGASTTSCSRALAAGERRAAFVAARPPATSRGRRGRSTPSGAAAARPRRRRRSTRARRRSTGTVAWVPDAPGADVLVVSAPGTTAPGRGAFERGRRRRLDRGGDPLRRDPLARARRARRTPSERRSASARTSCARPGISRRALIAAESLGAVEECLERSVAYAKERYTFGRAIGSYQAVKHALVEVLRRLENTRSLHLLRGLGATATRPTSSPLAASAARRGRRARSTSPRASDLGARRDRRDVGARRAAVLPPRAALAAPARRHRRGGRPAWRARCWYRRAPRRSRKATVRPRRL